MSRYDDIINLLRPISKKPMSMEKRAAQFSPFAALTGYEDAAREESRLTESKIELSESDAEELNRKLQNLAGEVSVTYFIKDEKKSGGRYVTIIGEVKRIDEFEKVLILRDGTKIPIEDIQNIDIIIPIT